MTQHTEGPWALDKEGKSFVVTAKDGTYDVAVVRNIGSENNEANARLIAAAPQLLEALQAFMALDKTFSTVCERHLNELAEESQMGRAVKLARAAIAAATGTPT